MILINLSHASQVLLNVKPFPWHVWDAFVGFPIQQSSQGRRQRVNVFMNLSNSSFVICSCRTEIIEAGQKTGCCSSVNGANPSPIYRIKRFCLDVFKENGDWDKKQASEWFLSSWSARIGCTVLPGSSGMIPFGPDFHEGTFWKRSATFCRLLLPTLRYVDICWD